MRVAPRHGLDDARELDVLARVEDAGLTVMCASEARDEREAREQAHETNDPQHVQPPHCANGRF